MNAPHCFYISGPISGVPDFKNNFARAETALQLFDVGTVNPANLGNYASFSWADYMRRDIAMLMHCTALFMLPGWERSPGARLERLIAHEIGMPIFYNLTEVQNTFGFSMPVGGAYPKELL